MSEWTGKGSKSRISDYRKYYESFDNIKFSHDDKIYTSPEDAILKKTFGYHLFLDDMRMPHDAYLLDERRTLFDASGIHNNNWVIVRSYRQFVEHIEEFGIPTTVSFDNDLNIRDVFDTPWMRDKTGQDCAKYLADKCKELNVDIPDYWVHSYCSTARPIIRRIMESARVRK